ncbi:glycoside hydrolase family 43 protein [Actinocatenispora sera]|uniref:glycoside hydrolase family 43 protein n=1 Tax=Actinocatenispora sera TaxID=390989 RepID=UPI0033DB2A65
MRRLRIAGTAVLLLALLAGTPMTAMAHGRAAPPHRTNATYFNAASVDAADPFVLYDKASGTYYAYSTDGADRGWHFAIYRSADLATWQKVPGGALPAKDANQWGNTWFWAPEVYHNPKTGLYFLFYAARSDANAAKWFGYADFEEPCKVGVAVSSSPAGPFHNITDQPIDYWPYDPDYHDVNLIMGPDQKQPPATEQEGETAPLGTYLPFIDPNVFFDHDGRVYLYFSRNAYRNWVWDDDLGKYIEESNIYAVELTGDWWRDPTGQTMPTIAPSYRDANRPAGDTGARKDGFVRILDYDHDKQSWENADVNDYAKTNGQNKDRRWEEGSTTWARTVHGRTVYYLTYSANNWQTPEYGVGYATADSPLGPWHKHPGNPVLSQNATLGMYSTGHGSIVASPDGSQLYYVHHGRPTATTPDRRLYTERLVFDAKHPDADGNPALRIEQSTADEPIPSGVAPYAIDASASAVSLSVGGTQQVGADVRNADGGSLALSNPLNRVTATIADPSVASLSDATGAGVTVHALRAGHTWLRLTYQRERADGSYATVRNQGPVRPGPVTVTVPITVLAGP